MTREEEIIQASIEFSRNSKAHRLRCRNFEKGAEWADRTMLDRACEWLRFRVCVNMPIETNENGEPLADSWIKAQMERVKAAEEFIAEFRQAMKGGAE